MPGPTKRPAYLKSISGTVQPCRAETAGLSLEPIVVVPQPPDWLPNAHAVKEWQRLTPLLVANRILAEADLSTLGHLCALHGKIVQLWAAGESPTGHMLAQYNALAGAFGLAGGWRSKVKPIGDKDSAGKFEKFKQPAG